MTTILNNLTPDQIDAILAVYATLADWYTQLYSVVQNDIIL